MLQRCLINHWEKKGEVMVKKLAIILVVIMNVGCLNLFRGEATYGGNSVSAEAVKAETAYIEISSDKEKITTTGSAIITAKIYNKFDVYFKDTEVSFYVNGEKEETTYTGIYTFEADEFESESGDAYNIYAQKGDVTSSAITITVK